MDTLSSANYTESTMVTVSIEEFREKIVKAKQILEENPDNPLEVMRYVKQMDEYHLKLIALTALILVTFKQANDMFCDEITILQSQIIQEKKRKNIKKIKPK